MRDHGTMVRQDATPLEYLLGSKRPIQAGGKAGVDRAKQDGFHD
jgi:hypothetical protein